MVVGDLLVCIRGMCVSSGEAGVMDGEISVVSGEVMVMRRLDHIAVLPMMLSVVGVLDDFVVVLGGMEDVSVSFCSVLVGCLLVHPGFFSVSLNLYISLLFYASHILQA